ncbi:MAG: type I 3-dehydroquinate dehydratase [Planctomycetaceae bacterium]|nr:type I 3-dehydroquinate dehydratase [Planctomycetaceae bacterium]
MICISVTPESRNLAKVDLLNASRYADMIELCLDRLIKAPDVGELTHGLDKPVIVSCRTPEDGGKFGGSEEERIALLRQAIISGPDYVELDLETATKIPRFGETKRVISLTSLDQPIGDVNGMFDAAWKAKADVVKFTWATPHFEDAWPLLKAVVDKRELPVVGMGIGKSGITFSLLGRKYGSPWLYAALEKGMEAFDGQASAFDLTELYDFKSITAKTRFIGLVGYDRTQPLMARVLNRGFERTGSSFRCLPFQVGQLDKIRKRLETLKVPGMFVNPTIHLDLHQFTDHEEDAVRESKACDLLFRKKEQWQGFNLLWRVMLKTIEGSLDEQGKTLGKQNVLVFGTNPLARSLIYGLNRRDCVVSVTSPDDIAAKQVAQVMKVRQIPFMNLYDTYTDVAVIADESLRAGHGKSELNPAFFRAEMTIADFSQLPLETEFTREASARGAQVIPPEELGFVYLSAMFKAVTGETLNREDFDEAVNKLVV